MVELGKFDIKYHPQGALKGQAVADFIAEYTHTPDPLTKMQDEPQKETDWVEWVMHIDGSSTNSADGGGAVLITPEKDKLEYAIRFGFKATNNEVEYESMIMRLCLAHALGARKVKVHSDSQLVVRQV